MLEINEVINLIETFAPIELAEEWDNSGWQINLGKKTSQKICLALSPSAQVIKQAVKEKCDLLITHHPLFFEKKNKFLTENITFQIAQIAIKNDIQIYCAHTNMDKAPFGLNYEMAKRLNLNNIKKVSDFVFQGNTYREYNVEEFSDYIKNVLDIKNIKLINPANKNTINTVSLCTGSGSEFINTVDTDVFITGDIKFHSALDITNKIVMDIGHFESEKFVVDLFKKIFKNKNIQIFIAEENTPWIIV